MRIAADTGQIKGWYLRPWDSSVEVALVTPIKGLIYLTITVV